MEERSAGVNCTLIFDDVYTWTIHAIEVCLAVLSLSLNSIIAVLTHRAAPIPYPLRRQLSALSMNFAAFGVIQLARNVFLLFSLYNPCMQVTNTATCKIQEFPLLFSYIHGGIIVCCIAAQTKRHFKEMKRPVPFAWMCSIWQTITVVFCIGITMLFTAFDYEEKAKPIEQCFVLLALRQSERSFWLLTLLILLHAFAVVYIMITIEQHVIKFNRRTVLTYSLRDVLSVETVAWHCSFLFSGTAVLYRYVVLKPCEECVRVTLEVSFVCLPLLIAFLHPILLVWFVYPIRDSVVRVFPSFSSVLPDYALVPPPPAKRRSSRKKRQQTTPIIKIEENHTTVPMVEL